MFTNDRMKIAPLFLNGTGKRNIKNKNDKDVKSFHAHFNDISDWIW
jgi:hypothetical protein